MIQYEALGTESKDTKSLKCEKVPKYNRKKQTMRESIKSNKEVGGTTAQRALHESQFSVW